MRFPIKTALHLTGSLIGLCGVVFVVVRLGAYTREIDLSRFAATAWALLSLLAVLYGAATGLLVKSWQQILAFFGISVADRWAIKAYGLAQIAKYVPGNIFHLAGRQALGMAVGLPGVPLAKSVMWELILFASAGAFFGILGWTLLWLELAGVSLMALFILAALGIIVVLRQLWSEQIGTAFAWQFAFLLVSSGVFVAVSAHFTPVGMNLSMTVSLATAYVIAWLAGLVTPGAPAGVGVRELVLLFLLKGIMNESDLLLAVVLGRFVTVLGDFLFFLYAYLLPQAPAQAA